MISEAEKAPPAESTTAPPAQIPEPAPEPVSQDPIAKETVPASTQPEETESPSANTDTALANSASYALNLPVSDVDSEMAKRKARAERFGGAAANGESGAVGTGDVDVDTQKALERAKRFGTGQTTMGKLDEALPADPGRGGRKRGRTEETSVLDDPALRRGFSGRGRGDRAGRFRGRGGRDNSRRRHGDKPSGVVKQGGVFSSEADRLAAEARKKKFGTA